MSHFCSSVVAFRAIALGAWFGLLCGCQSLPQQPAAQLPPAPEVRQTAPIATAASPKLMAAPAVTDANSQTSPELETAPEAPADAWLALRDRLRPRRCEEPRPQYWIKRYAGHPERFQARLTNYAPVLHYVAVEAEARGLPAEIALVPIVESTYQGYPGQGQRPAGMWQLIPSTARSLGLTVQAGRDDRLDTVAATSAALTLFERLLERFDQDLPLALAAYNAGDGRVARALAKSDRRVARELALSEITIDYLNKIVALSCLLADPAKYGFSMPPLPPPAQLQPVKLAFAADAQRIAVALRLQAKPFRRYNGAIRGPQIRHPGHNWLLPRSAVDALRQLDQQQIAATEIASGPPSLSADGIYVVKSGDNLWTLARRYGVSVSELRRWNGIPKQSTLRIGQRLKLTP